MSDEPPVDLDTDQIKTWRSIVTLIVFVLTSECLTSAARILQILPRPVDFSV